MIKYKGYYLDNQTQYKGFGKDKKTFKKWQILKRGGKTSESAFTFITEFDLLIDCKNYIDKNEKLHCRKNHAEHN
ncbi:MAG: hypothetical protein WCT77_10840 [Bacteroidota bacterium]